MNKRQYWPKFDLPGFFSACQVLVFIVSPEYPTCSSFFPESSLGKVGTSGECYKTAYFFIYALFFMSICLSF